MPTNLSIQHYLLHFDALAIDDVANNNAKNRAGIIGNALRSQANTVGVNPIAHLVNVLTPVGGPDRAAILVLITQMETEHPTELVLLIEENTNA